MVPSDVLDVFGVHGSKVFQVICFLKSDWTDRCAEGLGLRGAGLGGHLCYTLCGAATGHDHLEIMVIARNLGLKLRYSSVAPCHPNFLVCFCSFKRGLQYDSWQWCRTAKTPQKGPLGIHRRPTGTTWCRTSRWWRHRGRNSKVPRGGDVGLDFPGDERCFGVFGADVAIKHW